LIDPDGLIRIMYPATADAQGIAADLRQLWLLSAAKE